MVKSKIIKILLVIVGFLSLLSAFLIFYNKNNVKYEFIESSITDNFSIGFYFEEIYGVLQHRFNNLEIIEENILENDTVTNTPSKEYYLTVKHDGSEETFDYNTNLKVLSNNLGDVTYIGVNSLYADTNRIEGRIYHIEIFENLIRDFEILEDDYDLTEEIEVTNYTDKNSDSEENYEGQEEQINTSLTNNNVNVISLLDFKNSLDRYNRTTLVYNSENLIYKLDFTEKTINKEIMLNADITVRSVKTLIKE